MPPAGKARMYVWGSVAAFALLTSTCPAFAQGAEISSAPAANDHRSSADILTDLRRLLSRKIMELRIGKSKNGIDGKKTALVGDIIFIYKDNGNELRCSLSQLGTIVIGVLHTPWYLAGDVPDIIFNCTGAGGSLTILTYDGPDASQLKDDLETLKRRVTPQVDDSKFAEVVRAYRAATPRPSLPEEAHKFEVQAEDAVSQRQFQDAADLYKSALTLAPWWPAGHFNRALVLAETSDFQGAIGEMQKYLALVPDAPDARAAQDKIYVWQRRAQ